MVRSRTIISEHLGRIATDEEPAVVLEPHADLHRVLDVQLHVLHGETVRDGRRFLHATHNDRVPVLERDARDISRWKHGKLRFELRVDGGGEGLGEADERGQRLRVVLRLRQQVLGHRRRVGVVVGDH